MLNKFCLVNSVKHLEIMKIVLFLLFTFLVFSDAWVATRRKDPNYNGKAACYMESHGIGELEAGETKRYNDQCVKARCRSNGEIKLTGCGTLTVEPPCNVTKGDLALPHPRCCHKIICPEDFDSSP